MLHPRPAHPRRGTSILEVLIALAILSCGFIPLFGLLRGSRSALAQTREMLTLERRAHEALAHAARVAGSGALRDLGLDDERSLELSDPEVHTTVTVMRVPDRRLLRLTATAEARARRVTLSRELFDPWAALETPLGGLAP